MFLGFSRDVYMVFKEFCILVLWRKVASAISIGRVKDLPAEQPAITAISSSDITHRCCFSPMTNQGPSQNLKCMLPGGQAVLAGHG